MEEKEDTVFIFTVQNEQCVKLTLNLQKYRDGKRAYYSEPFPEGSKKYRIKFVKSSAVALQFDVHITCWEPIYEIQHPNHQYRVDVSSPNKNSLGHHGAYQYPAIQRSLTINQPCNDWKMICDNFDVNRDSIEIKITAPGDQARGIDRLMPWYPSEKDHDLRTFTLVGADDASEVEVLQNALADYSKLIEDQEEGVVTLAGVDSKALQELLMHLYGGRAPRTRAKRLFVLAQKYDMVNLKFSCAEVLYEQLKPDNAMEIMTFAAEHKYVPLVRALALYFDEQLKESS